MSAPPRIVPLSREEVDPESREALRITFPRAATFLADDPDAPPLPSILGLLARHTDITGAWLAYNAALLDHGALDARTRELLILAVAHLRSPYVWHEHVRIAKTVGVTEEEIEALDRGARTGWGAVDATLLRAVDELVEDGSVGDALWTVLAGHFDQRQLLELLFVVGTYTCLAMVVEGARVPPDDRGGR